MQEKIVRHEKFSASVDREDSDLVPDGVDDLGTTFYFRDDIAPADGRERR